MRRFTVSKSLDEAIRETRQAMCEASRYVLNGFELLVGVKPVLYPSRYMDPRGEVMWRTVTNLISEIEDSKAYVDFSEAAQNLSA